jgi:hypothetical protein
LQGFSFQHCFLKRMKATRFFESFDGGNFLSQRGANRSDARASGAVIDQHGAGSALTFAATVLASRKVQVIAQQAEKRTVEIGFDRNRLPVYIELWHTDTSQTKI